MSDALPQRKHPRLKNKSYSAPGMYFVTICTDNRRRLLSRIEKGEEGRAAVVLTEVGKIAEEQLLGLEQRFPTVVVKKHVIMPNHIHFVLLLKGDEAAGASPRPTVMDAVCAFKSLTTRVCKENKRIDADEKMFQTSFYEHIIRNREDYLEIARYIAGNPGRWKDDPLYDE